MSCEETVALRLPVSAEARRLVARLHERALRAVMLELPSGQPREHLYDILPLYPMRSSKGIRPVLCMAASAAFGGSFDNALPFAAALELLHNAFLVHDDIQDNAQSRRGRPALHVEHGTPLALNAGDALAAVANAALIRAARRLRPALARAVLEGWELMTRETLEGQALDLGWQRDNVIRLSPADYLAMCGKKTAWYTAIEPLAIGAIIGSGRAAQARETFRFGWFLGLLFQLANDLQGIREPAGESDIDEGKRTLLLIHLLDALSGEDRAEAIRIMGLPRHERGPEEVAWMLAQMDQAGSIDYARSCVFDLAAAAMREALVAFGPLPSSDARDLLLSMTGYVLEQSGVR
jgi:geranylgeranyl diphosphate synthase, type II